MKDLHTAYQSVNIGFRHMATGFISSNKNTKYRGAIFENMVNYNLTMENIFKIETWKILAFSKHTAVTQKDCVCVGVCVCAHARALGFKTSRSS